MLDESSNPLKITTLMINGNLLKRKIERKIIMKVEALRSKEEIQEFKTLLVEMNNGNTLYRDLFVFLSHTGYRISDARRVEFSNIKDDELEVREQKTGKIRRVKLHPAVLTMM
ncbi:site-specific integrase [Serratia marcescens]|uniref:hypothetical protein n=1 Tax=Serratia marcescens TaxID=615 RepID=UPI003FA7BA8C